ncbi:MAG: hypothetical protein WKF87_13445 [Chryseolinea sp.]
MDDKWLNRIVFWLLVAVPLVVLVMLVPLIGPVLFTMGVFLYAAVYRPIVNIFRLLRLGAIEEKDAWKFFIPFYHTRFMKRLFFG